MEQHDIHYPPVDIEALATAEGVKINKQPVAEEVSGFLFRDAASSFALIGVNKTQHPNRQRFTVAHELGHYLLHDTSGVHVDKTFTVRHRDARSSEGTDVEEMEANLFAAEILMPAHFIEKDVCSVKGLDILDEESIEQLARAYKVSSQAMAIRLTSLGYLPI
ncbi:MAG: ImmA/IrrE family metallo-endopeptidase [Chthoniobacteraceae bacterium]